jgi:hypothetical protein
MADKKRNKWGKLVGEDAVQEKTHEWNKRDMSQVDFYRFKKPKSQEHSSGDTQEVRFDAWRRDKEDRVPKICIWCKYGDEKAEKILKTRSTYSGSRTCPKCKRGNLCSNHMEFEEQTK